MTRARAKRVKSPRYCRIGFLLLVGGAVLVAGAPAMASAAGSEADNPIDAMFGGARKFVEPVVTVLVFVVLILVLGRFAWRPLLRALQDRERFIEESLAKAKADREAAEARLAEHTERLNRARQEATAIVEEGRRDAEVVQRRIQAEARTEAEALLERARREIGIARDTAVRELYDLAADLAVEVAGRIVRRELTPADHRQLIESALAEFREKHGGGNGEAG